MKQHGIDQLHSRGCLLVHGKEVGLLSQNGEPKGARTTTSAMYALKRTIIPPGRIANLPTKVQTVANGECEPGEGIVTGDEEKLAELTLQPGPPVLALCLDGGISTITVANLQKETITIPAGYRIGQFDKSSKLNINLIRPTTKPKDADPHANWTDQEKDTWLIKEFKLEGNKMLQKPKVWKAALRILRRHWKIYSIDGSFGKTHLLQHEIHTDNGPPTKEKSRPINPLLAEELRTQMEEWMKHDVIEESTSPWSFALVAVRKKNGKW